MMIMQQPRFFKNKIKELELILGDGLVELNDGLNILCGCPTHGYLERVFNNIGWNNIEVEDLTLEDMRDFDGLIKLDAVEENSHPAKHVDIVKNLKKHYPKAQMIVTTYSPHVIQSAEPNEIIPLIASTCGNVFAKKLKVGKYGFQGWTLEEILEDVMGMENTVSDLYSETISDFTKALDEDDNKMAIEKYKILKEMVHPQSHLRKLFEIQMAGMRDEVD